MKIEQKFGLIIYRIKYFTTFVATFQRIFSGS